jgi:transketolase
MTVLAPADGIEVEKMTRLIAGFKGPVYMRVNRNDLPDVFPEQELFEIGRPYVIREGTDAVVFAHGVRVSRALQTAWLLEKEGLSIRVVNVSTLKPVDDGRLRALAAGMKAVVTAEEHSLIGGLADVVAYALRGGGTPIQSIGINDCFGQSAHSYEELLQHYGLTAENVYEAVKEILK